VVTIINQNILQKNSMNFREWSSQAARLVTLLLLLTCHPMPTAEESVRCHSTDLTVGSLKDLQSITDSRRMQTAVSNEDVLSVCANDAGHCQTRLATRRTG